MRTVHGSCIALVLTCVVSSTRAESAREAPGLGDPGKLEAISIDTGRATSGSISLVGRDASQQLLVTGSYASGQVRDLTRKTKFTARPADVVQIDAVGCVTPLKEGVATIEARTESGHEETINVAVSNLVVDLPVNFPNEVVPIFTKYGCNGGGCHGKSGGQNGFALGLLGFEPTEDYDHLVRGARGRRVFPAAPDHSLLLMKATGLLPHGGGQKLEKGSAPYNTIRRWMDQGMPYAEENGPVVSSIEVLPGERRMNRDSDQQLVVVARYSDGSTRDVTRTAQFDSNDPKMARVSPTGLVTIGKLPGSGVIMVRYMTHVTTFRATVPLGVPLAGLPEPGNFIDEFVFARWRQLGLPPSPVSDDGTFLRRVTLDVAGRLPTAEETLAFLQDSAPNKREAVVDRLLADADYADFFASKWSAILRNKRDDRGLRTPTFAFHAWIRQSLLDNKPYDQFVRDVIASSGDYRSSPGTVWYREVKDATGQAEDAAQLFLGMRIQCARCHHHPFEHWSQEDYYGFQAFFSRVGRKRPLTDTNGPDIIVHQQGVAETTNPKTGLKVRPTGLGAAPLELDRDADPRHKLVDWMAETNNPYFAQALVNRYWKHFFGRGLIDPEDDMRVTNPASNPELLAALAERFITSRFDLKQLVRTVCTSRTYQLSALPNEWNGDDRQNFSRFYPRRLPAEVLLDAIDGLTQSETLFSGAAAGTRAVALPDNAFDNYFLRVFGRPDNSSACECERSGDANLAQTLHLLNSLEMGKKLAGPRALRLAAEQGRSLEDKIRELYMVALARDAKPEERGLALAHIEKTGAADPRGYQDIMWSLINSKEFLFNH